MLSVHWTKFLPKSMIVVWPSAVFRVRSVSIRLTFTMTGSPVRESVTWIKDTISDILVEIVEVVREVILRGCSRRAQAIAVRELLDIVKADADPAVAV